MGYWLSNLLRGLEGLLQPLKNELRGRTSRDVFLELATFDAYQGRFLGERVELRQKRFTFGSCL